MKVVVLLKQTFDTDEKVEIVNGKINEYGAKYVINPYDEYALEEALRIKEQVGAEVIALTVGPERCSVALRTALALGADQAIMICELEESDHSLRTATLMAEVIRPMQPDLILAGLFAVDSGSGSVALQLAQLLELPHAAAAIQLKIVEANELGVEMMPWHGKVARVTRDAEGDVETVLIPLPAVITAQQGLNEPRYPSLPGIMKSKKKAIIERYPSEVLTDEQRKQLNSSLTLRVSISPPPARPTGIQFTGSSERQVKQLIQSLLESNMIRKGER
ncbi:electron transfer flavoprotein subunit beta/FixA family protein [Paenibacillus septentrionalis]|uniref:Electron transfer flavoprotein subunit beta n=1 Tax=Paenibacillus septentrionalis TaxID=429342 RepID=A0ABW1V855_9BACL